MSGHQTSFLNVDLDLHFRGDIEELLNSIEPHVYILNRDEYSVSLELNKESNSLEETVVTLVEIIKSLPPSARAIWRQCSVRRFNIGIQGGDEPHETYFTLSNSAVSMLADIEADLAFTVYAVPQ